MNTRLIGFWIINFVLVSVSEVSQCINSLKQKKTKKKNECRVYNEKIKCTKFTSSSNNSQSIRFPMDFHTFKLN